MPIDMTGHARVPDHTHVKEQCLSEYFGSSYLLELNTFDICFFLYKDHLYFYNHKNMEVLFLFNIRFF